MQALTPPHNRSKRILIIQREGNVFNNPSLKCIIDLLLEKGYEIDIRYRKSHAAMPPVTGIRFLPFGRILGLLKLIITDRLCVWPLVTFSVYLENVYRYRKYDLIIGVDRHGLIDASALSRLTNTPFIFISFEIMFENETSAQYKSLERIASRDVSLWIVQDEVRAKQLQSENLLQPSNKFLLPLASAGSGELKTERLRDYLGIPEEKKVAIIIGSVASWSMINQIIKSVATWPDEWVLVVHERYGRTSKLLAKEGVASDNLNDSKIFMSDAATEMVDNMGSILAGVSVGLAFYKPDFKKPDIGKNLFYLGLAAGKISTYLRYGIPVIMNEIGVYAEEARQYKFGCVVDVPELIATKFDEIDQEESRSNAKIYFANKLDFNIYRNDIWSHLLSSMERI